jgi:hypothetical protein
VGQRADQAEGGVLLDVVLDQGSDKLAGLAGPFKQWLHVKRTIQYLIHACCNSEQHLYRPLATALAMAPSSNIAECLFVIRRRDVIKW